MWQDALNFVKPYYKQPHRFYHNFSHIEKMLDCVAFNHKVVNSDALTYAIFFHDIVYKPDSASNEEDSCKMYEQYYKSEMAAIPHCAPLPHPDVVCPLIMATKYPYDFQTRDCQLIVEADLFIFSSPISEILNYELALFKEYQKFPIGTYIEKRVEFLEKLAKLLYTSEDLQFLNIQWLINYIQNKTYKIGIYAGSFNPYHRGHQNIVTKAEKLFDKVIVAKGYNRDKVDSKTSELNLINEVISYEGLVTDLFKNPPENVEYTMIRGLRNGYDLQYEDNLRKFIFDQNPEIQVVYIFCDREYDHISSSMIRGLTEFGENVYGRYLP